MEQRFRIIIISDNGQVRDLLRSFVEQIDFLEYIGTFDDLVKASGTIQKSVPELALIEIPTLQADEPDWAMLQSMHATDLIIISGSPEHSVKSYELGVIDFIVHPFSFERLLIAINRFARKHRYEGNPRLTVASIAQQNSKSPANSTIWVREEKRLIQLKIDDVFYVEGLKDYVKIFLTNEMIVTHLTIGKAETIFTPPHFLRVHRSFIVRKSGIRFIQGNSVFLTDGREIPMGPNYREEIKKNIFI